ncbi:MAG: D-alanyl-D-alanine carboxypeptidase family protein [Gomphosphaeria aponina SAG 52.96 = DSM 107014]|uniref:D-alanyl-D-alanine carboxypeptidase family protein n=1 Tax=Gomphosphaeria aponina SAG 52.96 = DSM 107014 TaxID=1521640 RepID=A0A941JNS8_9CHRO|nr:D-alanyl-D-alanine carboxypeptidase family protein [Gomphosphaeria aponina SAG 52.96 = DSM 107014]
MKDIPEALRDKPESLKEKKVIQGGVIMSGFVGLGVIALLSGLLFLPSRSDSESQPNMAVDPQPSPIETPQPIPKPQEPENILGHLVYEEAPLSQLKAVTADGRVKLRIGAAEKFLAMQAAARADGIILAPISGFRSEAEQEYLFFEVKEKRGQVTTKRAAVSAPPGYSEHHTGYAIDLGDGKAPATDLLPDFEKTSAFQWLRQNAAKYSFELSFPKDNPQGISYEPWHWRFVGDRQSLETFYKAKKNQKPIDNNDQLSN